MQLSAAVVTGEAEIQRGGTGAIFNRLNLIDRANQQGQEAPYVIWYGASPGVLPGWEKRWTHIGAPEGIPKRMLVKVAPHRSRHHYCSASHQGRI
jgi:hypothetical protein